MAKRFGHNQPNFRLSEGERDEFQRLCGVDRDQLGPVPRRSMGGQSLLDCPRHRRSFGCGGRRAAVCARRSLVYLLADGAGEFYLHRST